MLNRCGVSKDILRSEWEAQKVEQTKPAPRKSINLFTSSSTDKL